MNILEIENLNVVYTGRKEKVYAVNNVSLSIAEGESVGIVGESGSGKSTLAMAVLRLLSEKKADVSGTINFQGKDILGMSLKDYKQIRWKEISVVFQKSMNALSPIHKIGGQLEDIYRVHEPNENKKVIKEKILKLFTMVNLSDRVYNLYPHELSGGMLQRVSIALSLIHNPSFIVLDEATTALDVVTQGQILREIKKLETEIKMTRMMITHDISVVATSCDKVVVMYAGKVMEVGNVKDVLTKPAHPYTQGLLNSFPSLKGEKKQLTGIRGFLPDLSEKKEGCIFAPRCDFAKDICRNVTPKDYEVSSNQRSACHMHGSEYYENRRTS
ncbi:ABC transporter ATP-binding protein [Cytobacillus depressus]|uniref:ABC transporter ATP-binding protein n=1 Tax=Cytobacillus depressus TaxID=1602942 RepID=UPI001BA518FD|nr:ABC transporter ATP-binding protein [Cytobacillus depressus]